MRWPFITRKKYQAKIDEFEARLHDLERHFVTRRDPATGQVTETLADRVEKRFNGKSGKSWQQVRAWLELTDGGRRPLPSSAPGGAVKMASKAEEKAASGEQSGT